jgi:DNA invertase Pin-like site-specific DNA recombinase
MVIFATQPDQLLLQIRGAVAEYERTLIADRMRRGRQQKFRAGTLLPWSRACIGYLAHPFVKEALCAFIVSFFLSVRWD